MKALATILLAIAAGGCAGQAAGDRPSRAPDVALAHGRELAEIDAALAGAARVAVPSTGTRRAIDELGARAVRADAELRRAVDVRAPGGGALRTAAADARGAAAALARQRPDRTGAMVRLRASAAALGRAAAALAPRLPAGAEAGLERLRAPLPPP
jgi:hypothetical protein